MRWISTNINLKYQHWPLQELNPAQMNDNAPEGGRRIRTCIDKDSEEQF